MAGLSDEEVMAMLPVRQEPASVTPAATPVAAPSGFASYMKSKPAEMPRALTDEEVMKLAHPEQMGVMESFGRGMTEGATFGLDTKLGMSPEARERAHAQHPYATLAGEFVGGLAPLAASYLLPNPASTPVATARTGNVLYKAGQLARSALLPAESATLGGAMLQGAKAGATWGGLNGLGHTDEIADIPGNVAKGAVSGMIVGAPLSAAAHGVGRFAQNLASARAAAEAETSDASAGALNAMGRAFERDRITPAEIIDQIRQELPRDSTYSANIKLTPGDVETLVRNHLDGVPLSQTAKEIGITPQTAQRYVNELADRSNGPLNIVDRAGMTRTGSGTNTQMTMRAAAATPGEAQAIAREGLIERQIGQNGRLSDAISKIVGSPDFDAVASRHSDRLAQASDAAYQAAKANERAFDLQPIVDKWVAQFQGKRGPVPEAVVKALDSIHGDLPNNGGSFLPRNLQEFIDARQNIQSAIDTALGSNNKQVASKLIDLKNQLSDEVAKSNPLWKEANNIYRDGMAAKDAMDAGTRMTTRINSQSRDAVSEFADAQQAERAAKIAFRKAQASNDPVAASRAQAAIDASQSRQELFKVGLARSLNDMLSNTNMTNDLTRQLRLPGARKMLTQVLGKEDATRFFKVIDSEHAMNRTYASQFGSQTTPLKEAIEDLNWAPRMSGALDYMHPSKIMDAAVEQIAKRYNATRNQNMMPLLTDTNLIRQLDTLRALNQVSNARQAVGSNIRDPLLAATAPGTQAAIDASREPTDVGTIYPSPSNFRPVRP